jgi:hypothetical protein
MNIVDLKFGFPVKNLKKWSKKIKNFFKTSGEKIEPVSIIIFPSGEKSLRSY